MTERTLCPSHGGRWRFDVLDDCLCIGGVPVTRLALRAGGVPFYVYDRSAIKLRVSDLRSVLPKAVHLHYAMKANPMPAVVQLMASLVDGLDVASGNELRVALDTGFDPQDISFAGPAKRTVELTQAAAAGAVVNVESEQELEKLARISDSIGLRARYAVRVNPDFELKSSGMRMGGGPKQFGIDAEKVADVMARAKTFDLDFTGLHIFSGSQNLRADAIVEAQTNSVDLALRLAEQAPTPIKTLNIGGGFGVPYFPGEKPLDLDPIADNLDHLASRVHTALPGARLVLELGRYLVAEAGVYVCSVVERKESRGQVFLVADGGLNHHLAASGNFGQVIRKNYPVVVANKIVGSKREIVTVVGPLCTPLDMLAERLEMARAEPGDLIAVLQSGAYGLTASPTDFLSHPRPVEILV